MVTVSDFPISVAYALNQQIAAEKIINDIKNLINKYNSMGQSDGILKISIQPITQISDELIPKLEYKNI